MSRERLTMRSLLAMRAALEARLVLLSSFPSDQGGAAARGALRWTMKRIAEKEAAREAPVAKAISE